MKGPRSREAWVVVLRCLIEHEDERVRRDLSCWICGPWSCAVARRDGNGIGGQRERGLCRSWQDYAADYHRYGKAVLSKRETVQAEVRLRESPKMCWDRGEASLHSQWRERSRGVPMRRVIARPIVPCTCKEGGARWWVVGESCSSGRWGASRECDRPLRSEPPAWWWGRGSGGRWAEASAAAAA